MSSISFTEHNDLSAYPASLRSAARALWGANGAVERLDPAAIWGGEWKTARSKGKPVSAAGRGSISTAEVE